MSTVFTPARARLTVAQYHKMGDAGIIPPDARLELVDGEMLEMAPIGPRHMQVVNRLNRALVAAVGDAAVVSVQNPVVLGERSEPQPDLALLRPEPDGRARLPNADDVLLLIEVADTTLQYDRATKLLLYARHGIGEVWIVNLVDRVVEIYRDLSNSAYRVKIERGADDTVAPIALPGVKLRLADIL